MRTILGCTALAALLAGCGGDEAFTRVAATGSVSLDGAPVPYATILLEGPPDEMNQSVKSTIQIRDGKFAVEGPQGPQVGKNSVQISLYDAVPQTVADPGGRSNEILGKHLGNWQGTFDVEDGKPLVFDLKRSDLIRR